MTLHLPTCPPDCFYQAHERLDAVRKREDLAADACYRPQEPCPAWIVELWTERGYHVLPQGVLLVVFEDSSTIFTYPGVMMPRLAGVYG